jgi:hypothetical protein
VIKSVLELETTLERIGYFHRVVVRLRETETNPANYKAAAGGFLAEIDRMNLEVREYLALHPSEVHEDLVSTGTR